MDNSIYIMLSKQTMLFREMDVRANNLANVATTGYNRQAMVFNPYEINAGNNEKMSFVKNAETFRDTSAGAFQPTGNPLDMAIQGKGYFSVETPLGTRYTRAGNFQIDREGTLITSDGYPVLDDAGQHIQFEENDTDIVVGEAGNISVKGVERGTVGVVEFENEQQLERAGNTLFRADATPVAAEKFAVQQGTLEGSNVQAVSELTGVIELSRQASATSKFIENMYDLERKASTTLTKAN